MKWQKNFIKTKNFEDWLELYIWHTFSVLFTCWALIYYSIMCLIEAQSFLLDLKSSENHVIVFKKMKNFKNRLTLHMRFTGSNFLCVISTYTKLRLLQYFWVFRKRLRSFRKIKSFKIRLNLYYYYTIRNSSFFWSFSVIS